LLWKEKLPQNFTLNGQQPSAWTEPTASGNASKATPNILFMDQSSCDKVAPAAQRRSRTFLNRLL
jgi:hypothetical protein